MKLAAINSNITASCFLCGWGMKSPSRRKNSKTKQEVVLSIEERLKILEQNIVTHLKFAHDKMLLTKETEVVNDKEEGMIDKILYHGRMSGRIKWTTINRNR